MREHNDIETEPHDSQTSTKIARAIATGVDATDIVLILLSSEAADIDQLIEKAIKAQKERIKFQIRNVLAIYDEIARIRGLQK